MLFKLLSSLLTILTLSQGNSYPNETCVRDDVLLAQYSTIGGNPGQTLVLKGLKSYVVTKGPGHQFDCIIYDRVDHSTEVITIEPNNYCGPSDCPASVTIDDDERLCTVYHSRLVDKLNLACFNHGLAHSPNKTELSSGPGNGKYNGLRYNSEGNLVIAHSKNGAGGIDLLICTQKTNCTDAKVNNLPHAATLQSLNLVLRDDKYPIIGFVDGNLAAHIYLCFNEDCTSQNKVLVSSSALPFGSDLILDDGIPYFTYAQPGGSTIVAICDDLNCTTITPVTVHVVADLTFYPSIAKLPYNDSYIVHNLVLISGTYDLMQIICKSKACAGIDKEEMSLNLTAWKQSTEIDENGNIIVSYNDFTREEVSLHLCRYETPNPTLAPTPSPSASPTLAPTLSPSPAPTLSPTPAPTGAPTLFPTPAPTFVPSLSPTVEPTRRPTPAPKKGFDDLKEGEKIAIYITVPIFGLALLVIGGIVAAKKCKKSPQYTSQE